MNNLPAFPCPETPEHCMEYSRGMTLRDYFAAKAIQGILANHEQFYSGDVDEAMMSRWCYAIADSMLKAREEK